jgi:general nucleoside transport system permease protein
VLAGMALAVIHAVFAVLLRADQILSGFALTFIAAGLTGYLYVDKYGEQGTPDDLPAVPDVHLPIEGWTFIGRALSDQNLLVWGGLLSVLVVWFVLFRMARGLRLRSVGENPRAAETVGVNVIRMRFTAVVISGGLAALGGAFLSIGFVHSFTENMTAGRGYIGLAAMIFGNWRPGGLAAGAGLFGYTNALQLRQGGESVHALLLVVTILAVAFAVWKVRAGLPQQAMIALLVGALVSVWYLLTDEVAEDFTRMTPYVATLLVLALASQRLRPPAADGLPYRRGQAG